MIHNIDRAEYDRMERWNFSRLRMLAKTPKHFQYSNKFGSTDSAARKFGRVVHLAVLEPNDFEDRIAIWDRKVAGKPPKKGEAPPPPSDKIAPRNGAAWEEFKAENAGKEIITREERDEAMAIANAIYEDEDAAPLLSGGAAEVTISWEFDGLLFKARLDFITPTHVVEIKKTRNADTKVFPWDAEQYLYHAQAAMQLDGHLLATNEQKEHAIIAVEDSAPYVSQVYFYGDAEISAGRAEYQRWISMLHECQRTKTWRGYADGPVLLSLPRRARMQGDESEAA